MQPVIVIKEFPRPLGGKSSRNGLRLFGKSARVAWVLSMMPSTVNAINGLPSN